MTLLVRLKVQKIGLLSYVGKPLFIIGGRRIIIGNKVRIFPGARFETHNNGHILIEDDVSIGQNFHLISSNQELVIGKHTTISGNVFITNMDHQYDKIGIHVLKQDYLVKTTNIGENCFIGYGAVIQAGTTLGKQCIVGANSVVRGSYPDYCVIVGSPGRIVKQYNVTTQKWEKMN
ncbi:acyltransferase [Mucilaginibacter sp. JRF]|uniref:acyltransferase n=1 Tax=Mucilaginibacter sp. JRF TaxID=2780088 RepID=UPI001D16D1D7|nr:acyltransferase [Mucilaginibacter sp. JRF]